IGRHFTDISDKLINTLQLKKLSEINSSNVELIEAGINQKIGQLKPIPFIIAIDLSKNKKYLKYAVFPLLFIILILFAAPSIITDSTKRLINHGTFYEKEAPFSFSIVNKKLEAIQQEDFVLNVKIKGNEIPDVTFVVVNGNQYQLTKDNTVNFHYNFKNLQKNTKFQLYADGFYSKEYELAVLPKPIILNFGVTLNYPAYINKKNEYLQNTGDVVIPEGTEIKWNFLTRDTKDIILRFKDNSFKTINKNENSFSYSSVFNKSQGYSIIPTNEYLTVKDSLLYAISVIPDAYPTIKVIEQKDSVLENKSYFKGMIKDDYGFKGLIFYYRKISNTDSLLTKPEIKVVTISNSVTQQEFYYYFDFSTIATQAGDEFEYYFEVWDNDGVNGSKSSRSSKMIYKLPSQEEQEAKTEKTNEQIKNDLIKSISEAKQLQKDIEDFNKKLVDKKTLSWQEKKQMQDLLDKEQKLQNKIELIQKENIQKTAQENQYNKESEDLLKKQDELNKLFNELMTDEMKEMFKKIQEMLDKLDKNKVAEILDKMKLSNKDIEKQLDRNLELFKQLEFEKKLTKTIEKLNELSEKQEKLSKETDKSDIKNNKEYLEKKQEDLNKEFDDIKKDLNDVEKKNQELEEPNKLDSTNKEQNSIQEEMNKSLENIKDSKNKKASQSQKNASEQMEELAQKLEDMQNEMEQENAAEDINSLRDILENLIKASLDQEKLMSDLADMKTTDPKYVSVMQNQKKLKDDLQMIEDSLFALSKRQSQIETFVNQEISEINDNVSKAISFLAERGISAGKARQQLAMTSINNLALMLSETLNSMQQQSGKPGSGKCSKPGSCSKPGTGNPSFKSMKKLQEQLNKQMQEMKDGKNPNGKNGQKSMSEQLAKMAAQQEAIRKQLQELMDQLKKDGQANSGELNDLQSKMEETETDLVNKIISSETIKRQQEILTRLLESEKAEKEREMDEKRESNEAKNEIFSNPAQFLEYKSIKLKEVELLKTVPPSLKVFYKNKVNEYFYNFEE
ncbi:MAG: hypothetical protein HGB12_10270, partial [Bacteroidetes bacterium]|nr:hypothetical protein [Bacteroidota bacterium]